MLFLEHGEPMVFGKDRDKGIRLNGVRPEVVHLGNGFTEADLLVHDEASEDPTIHFMLARIYWPEFPVPVGVIRNVPRTTHDALLDGPDHRRDPRAGARRPRDAAPRRRDLVGDRIAGRLVTAGRVVVLADDLIWADRLAGLVRAAGAEPVRAARPAAWDAVIVDADRAIVDLTARAYDGVAAVARAHDAGVPVLCVAQHDDVALRKRALAAGADRVLAYRALAERGPAIVAAWLGSERDLSALDDGA